MVVGQHFTAYWGADGKAGSSILFFFFLKPEVPSCLQFVPFLFWLFTQVIWKVIYLLFYHHCPFPQHTHKHKSSQMVIGNTLLLFPSPQQFPENFFPVPKSQGGSHTSNSSEVYPDILKFILQAGIKQSIFHFPCK